MFITAVCVLVLIKLMDVTSSLSKNGVPMLIKVIP